ncbi:Uncharacterized protein PBTT_07093 [Plasmodiophora brassicae]
MPGRQASTGFNKAHCIEYGLKIIGRDPATHKVRSLRCQFCAFCGREEKVGAKRKKTENVKYFDKFKAQYYLQHIRLQHAKEWETYRLLSNDDKLAYFENRQNCHDQAS